MMQKLIVRLQNKTVLLSLFSGVLMILLNTGVITGDVVDHYNALFNTILSLLVAMGVVGDPESHVKNDEEVM